MSDNFFKDKNTIATEEDLERLGFGMSSETPEEESNSRMQRQFGLVNEHLGGSGQGQLSHDDALLIRENDMNAIQLGPGSNIPNMRVGVDIQMDLEPLS